MKNKFESYSRFLPWFMALLLSAWLAGCGGGGQDAVLGTENAGIAPMVTSVSPLPKTIGVPINTKIITAAFTKAMDPATLTTASFTLACPAGTPQTGTVVGYVTHGDVATLTLAVANSLPANTVCTATVTTGAKDATGIPLASDFAWTFTTGATPDTTAPTVTGTIYPNGSINVPVNTKLSPTFSEAMDPLTINATTFTLMQGTTPVAGTVSYAGVNAVFTPASNLAPSTTYTATVTTGAKDVAGNAMASNFVWSWTTAATPDTTAPTVTGTIHTNGATNVAVNTNVGATFSEAMNPLTITNLNFTLSTDAGAVVPGVVSYSGVSAVFNPVSDLAASTHYNVTVKGGANGVKDLAGNPMAADFKIGWTTGTAPDTTAPTVTGTINANGAINVAINTNVGATFSEGMNPLTITNVNFTLKETVSGTAVVGVVSYSGVSAVFNPVGNLASSTKYTATVKGGVSGVKDLAGNPMTSDFVWSWTTAATPDTTAPTVTGTINANGAINVAINTNVGATFSEGMNPLTITSVNFTLTTDAGVVLPGTVSYSGVSAVFHLANDLAPNSHYNVTVKGGSSGVKDLAGNPMAADFKIGWTTGATPDTTAPTVTGTINANGAINVAIINTNVGATFSEGMNPLTVTNLNFTLKETVSGTAVIGVTSYAGVSAVFHPVSNLAPNTRYTATVKGGSSGVKDLAGNSMVSDFVWSWTTGAVADTTSPTVSGTIHANGQTNVAFNTNVGATFSEAMNPLTISNLNFTLTTDAGAVVPGIVSYSGVSAVFDPVSDLAASTHYNVTVKGGSSGVKDLAGNPMAADFKIGWTTGAAPDTTAPTVIGTINANGAINVAINTNVGATFSEGMNPLTVTNLNFTLKETVSGTAVVGVVSYSGVSAVFNPVGNLAGSTKYTATVKGGVSGVKDLADNPMASDFVWSWTTGVALDTTAPTVSLTVPATNVMAHVETLIAASFSEAMDPLTITTASFTLGGVTPVNGTVIYNMSTKTASFTPLSPLAPDTWYTATITASAKDIAGNALASGLVPNPWRFLTPTSGTVIPTSAAGPAPVALGEIGHYAVFGGSGTAVSVGPTTRVTGDVGVGTAVDSTAITGLYTPLVPDPITGQFSTSTLVIGKVYAKNYLAPTPANIILAENNMLTAWNDAKNRLTPDATNLQGGNLVLPQTFIPGLYKWPAALDLPFGSTITLSGGSDDVWIFQIGTAFTTGGNTQIILTNPTGGALPRAKNIFWQMGTSLTTGAGSKFVGVALTGTFITLGNLTTVDGRLLAQTAVTLDTNQVVQPAP